MSCGSAWPRGCRPTRQESSRHRLVPRAEPWSVDRARPGSRHHVIVNRHGTPLAVSLTGGNRHDVPRLIPLLGAIASIRWLRGRPCHRAKRRFADRGYDFDKHRRLQGKHGTKPFSAHPPRPPRTCPADHVAAPHRYR
ncbi:transposase [Streptomyces mooreae]